MKTEFSKDQSGKPYLMFQPELPMEAYEFRNFAKEGITKGIEIKVNGTGKEQRVVILVKEEKKEEPKKEETKNPK